MTGVVALDWDGTLCDSRERHKVVLDDILKDRNIRIDTSDLIEFKRSGKNNVAFLMSKGLSEEIAGQIQEKADMLPQKHPHEFKDFRFDVQAYLDQS